VKMKFISLNDRSLGGGDKRKEVSKFVEEKVPFILCIQEIKLVVVDDLLCFSILGNTFHAFSFRSSI